MKKRIILFFAMAALSIVCAVGVGAETYGNLTYRISDDKVTITDCDSSATSVTIPETIDGYPVTSIGDRAFSGCTDLTSIIISDSVTSIGDQSFSFCTGLISVTIPDSVTSIGSFAFHDTPWYYNKAKPDGLIYINKVLYDYKGTMPSNTKIDIIPGTVSISDYAFSGCTGLMSITIPDSVTSIGERAFSGCAGLTSITIPDSVTCIGDRAFFDCTGLTSVAIPDSVVNIGYDTFSNTPWYNAKPDGLIYINNMLYKYKGTMPSDTKIDIIPGTVSISVFAFFSYTELTSVTIPDSVTSIGDYAFFGCTGLTSIVVPDSVTSIGAAAFGGCTGLTSVTIPDGVTSIDNYAFCGCTGLTSITIPDSVTSIGDDAFSRCISLTSITIPDSVTSIGSFAFFDCTSLTSITIPASVEEISGNDFDSTQLTDIYYCGTEKEWKNINILNGNEPLFQATLHCAPELPNQLVLTIGQRTAHAFGHTKINDVAPVVVNGRTMLPVRFLAENLGATVAWNEEKQLVTITGKNQNQEDVTIFITIGAANAQINGQSVALEAPAFVDQNRTFMPVRLIAEALGASVDWNEAEQKVIITKM